MAEEKGVDFIKWFSEMSNKDVPIAGGKGASLAEMYNLKIPVPPGFVVTAQAYSYFLKKTGTGVKINEVLKNLDVNNTEQLNKISKEIRKIIESAQLPKELQDEILESYEILSEGKGNENAEKVLEKSGEEPFVAVRSSATTEDLADASFAGQQDTFLNVKGKEELLEKAKKCMSSLFTPRAIYYREKKGFAHDKSYLAVVVQKMINANKSGVMFSQNPTSSNKSIVIEAVWGLGEGIVSGRIKPDHYDVDNDLENFKITKADVAQKKTAIIKNEEGKNETITLNEEQSKKRVLDNYEIKRLAQFARQLEEHYKKPQDIEFAIDSSGIYIVQSRPITTTFKASTSKVSGDAILSGLGASPGVASGTVKVIHDISELEKVQKGDVMVTEMTNPDMVVSMEKSSAIVTDEGGVTSHAAIVSREMGIPAVVGTGDATKKLKDGEVITVDGNVGKVYAGKGETKLAQVEPIVKTKTEIKVIVDIPNAADRAAKSGAKGIGLMRLEGLIAEGGIHPLQFVKENKTQDYIKLLSEGIKEIMEHFEKIWIRTSDIRSDEFRNLKGAMKEVEGNPMLGDHGVRFSLKHKDIMKAELLAIKEVADDMPDKTFGIMMPQIISVSEVQETKKLAREVGIPKNFEIGIMVETPAAVQIIEDFCKEGIAFVSFGTNDLTQYTLAIDRNNEEVQNIYDEMHPAVLRSIAHVIQVCRKYNVQTSICGQAGSRPEMAKFLVKQGITSISVNADAAKKVSEIVAEIENNSSLKQNSPEQEIPEFEQPLKQEEQTENAKQIEISQNIQEGFDRDIEDAVLEALGDNGNYNSGTIQSANQEIPPLNESIPIDSSAFNGEISNEEAQLAVEEELETEARDFLGKEWKGEKKNN